MGINVFPAPSAGGGIKSVQRGLAGGAGNVTITAVDTSKSFVNIYGTASSGTVAAAGSLSGGLNATTFSYAGAGGIVSATGNISGIWRPSGTSQNAGDSSGFNASNGAGWTSNSTVNAANFANANITGGSNNLVAAIVQGFLANSTTLTVSGACRWEVVEFN